MRGCSGGDGKGAERAGQASRRRGLLASPLAPDRKRALLLALFVLATSQVGSLCAGSGHQSDAGCTATTCGTDAASQEALTTTEVRLIIARAAVEAQSQSPPITELTIAVTDRVNNVLAVYQTGSASLDFTTTIASSDRTSTVVGGLEGLVVPNALAAITKAGTASFVSSIGGAFTTRTANQITQENFNPLERFRPGGPLFGIQFSQLPCSDFSLPGGAGDDMRGPKRLPLGFTTDPGGVPLYKNGIPVGGVGIEYDGRVTNDRDILNVDTAIEERIALAAAHDMGAPARRQATLVTLEGRSLRFIDDNRIVSNPGAVDMTDYASLTGGFVKVLDFFEPAVLDARPGTVFLSPASGVVPGTLTAGGDSVSVEVLNDAGAGNRYPSSDSGNPATPTGLSAEEVDQILFSTIALANQVRAQVRRPLGEPARVSIAVVDLDGTILGFARGHDALLFGPDVAAQKARTAAFFSAPTAGADLTAAGFGANVVATGDLFDGNLAPFDGTFAYSTTTIGAISRPFFPNGVNGNRHGPLSLPFAEWSQFNTGLQLDLVAPGILLSLCQDPNDPALASYSDINQKVVDAGLFCEWQTPSRPTNCTDGLEGDNADLINNPLATNNPFDALSEVQNGFQIFSGGVPIYRGGTLIGGIGISGDGAEQDDLLAFLGLARASAALGGSTPPINAPTEVRSDNIRVDGNQLRYVRCPPAPFLGSNEQNACTGN